MEGGQLDRVGVLGPHLVQHFLKRVELIVLVHVVLVDLKTRKRFNGADVLLKLIEIRKKKKSKQYDVTSLLAITGRESTVSSVSE